MRKDEEMDDETEETDGEDYETGPFCRHWSDPSDCDVLCKCGHKCCQHSMYEDGECNECDCEHFTDVE